MTKKSKKTNKSDTKEVIADIDELIQKINSSDNFFVITKEVGYLVVGTVHNYKIRVEKSGNIFQPFGKNVEKYLPIYFPVIFDRQKASASDIVYGFNEFDIPILHINKRQIKLNNNDIETIIFEYFCKNFHCHE